MIKSVHNVYTLYRALGNFVEVFLWLLLTMKLQQMLSTVVSENEQYLLGTVININTPRYKTADVMNNDISKYCQPVQY